MKPNTHRLARFLESAIPLCFTLALTCCLTVMLVLGLSWALAGVLR